jgi:hypothetical protein
MGHHQRQFVRFVFQAFEQRHDLRAPRVVLLHGPGVAFEESGCLCYPVFVAVYIRMDDTHGIAALPNGNLHNRMEKINYELRTQENKQQRTTQEAQQQAQ